MKRRTQAGAITAAALVFASLAWQQTAGAPALTRYLPTGALLVAEAQDFRGLWTSWNASPEKAAWLASDNYSVFSRSKLFFRLSEAHQEFAAAASFAPDWALVDALAGREAALALYDIGELRFVYITEMEHSRALESALVKAQANFEPRRSGGLEYFVRVDDASGRTIAYASTPTHFLLATDDNLLGQALALLAGQGGRSAADDAWYGQATNGAGGRGELRLVENLRALTRTPHFRSYWLQQNITALGAYEAATADVVITADEVRETRRLVRQAGSEAIAATRVGDLVRLAPPEAGLYRAWHKPTPQFATELLRQKLLAPAGGYVEPRYEAAPGMASRVAATGSAGDLERLIDVPPVRVSSASFDAEPLAALLRDAELAAALHLQSSDQGNGSTLKRTSSAVALLRSTAWNAEAARDAIGRSARGLWTTASLGAGWRQSGRYFVLDGLKPLFVFAEGDLLVIADAENLLTTVLARVGPTQLRTSAVFAASFRHSREADAYRTATGHLDYLQAGHYAANTDREPYLFSETIGGLSRTLERIAEIEVQRIDNGDHVAETVRYRLR